MEKLFETIRQNRKVLSQILKQIPMEKLVKIPPGFNNNIWWNMAHVVVTQQLLMYGLSNLPMASGDDMVSKYRKGTYPQGTPTRQEIEQLEALLLSTVEMAESDYTAGLFKEFREYTTSVGVTLRNIDDAIVFNTFHEGLHLGVIMSLRKLVD